MAAELVGREQLGNAITLSLLSMNGTRVFAPALAGFLAGIAFVGIGGAYVLSAVMSFVSLVQIWRLPHRPAADATPRNPLTEIRAGVSYVNSDRRLRRIVVSSFFVIMFGFNYVAFIPALVEGIFDLGDTYVGLVSSAGAIGAVAVSLPLAAKADGPGGQRIMVISGLGFGIGVILLGLAPTIWLSWRRWQTRSKSCCAAKKSKKPRPETCSQTRSRTTRNHCGLYATFAARPLPPDTSTKARYSKSET
jgi:hypothetical protein